MGWTGYAPSHFYSGGTVNRKAECDAYFTEGLNAGFYNVVKSAMVGSIYYAAVQAIKRYVHDANGNMVKDVNGNYITENIPAAELKTIGVVFRTQVEDGMFYYKDTSETMGPIFYGCPRSIIQALSPTDDEDANNWRKKCLTYHDKIKPSQLPVGSIIRFEWDKKIQEIEKQPPRYQFKKSWWKVCGDDKYFKKKDIPKDFEIVKMGGK